MICRKFRAFVLCTIAICFVSLYHLIIKDETNFRDNSCCVKSSSERDGQEDPRPFAQKLTKDDENQQQVTKPPANERETLLNESGKFKTLFNKYKDRLTSVKRHAFQPKQKFVEYGKPVGKVPSNNVRKIKRVLQWTPYFGKFNWIPNILYCPGELYCYGSADKRDILISDAVLFHSSDFTSTPMNLPNQRLSHQRWIHFSKEPPHFSFYKTRNFHEFNWTSTYRLDSDIPYVYFRIQRRGREMSEKQFSSLFEEILKSKSKLVAQISSNCDTVHTNRLAYVSELQKYVSVDRYGKCGSLTCPRNRKCKEIMKQYKFYMAMENSNCREYITEKVREPLFWYRSVPIVMGGANPEEYEKILPPNSYIHSSGFNSPEELAEYILLLDRNPHLYERYHRWRKTHEEGALHGSYWCDLCRKLNNESLPLQTYRDFVGWQNEDTCKVPKSNLIA